MKNITKLTISLVVYRPNLKQLKETLNSLIASLEYASVTYHIYIFDNTPPQEQSVVDELYLSHYFETGNFTYSRADNNVGFGVAHNRSLSVRSEFHLIINPDLVIEREAILNAICFMSEHERCGLITPFATWENGVVQRLCKQYPSVLVLLLRGFAPALIKKPFTILLDEYEMVGLINHNEVYWNPPMVSGCFMFFKTAIWQKCRGFDKRYFLYFEDFDLSIRTKKFCDIAYVPSVKVVHHGGYAARKGLKHILLFFRSMLLFFKIHNWRWF